MPASPRDRFLLKQCIRGHTATVTASTSLVFSLTVTDSTGAVSSPATVTISVS